jgi:disulfide bond formation protein DsbB
MTLLQVSRWAESRSAWAFLFFTSLSLEIAALIFQHGFDFQPCVMCIYQRTAMWGVVLAAASVLIINTLISRLLGYAIWLISSIWGAILAWEHIDMLTAANPFFVSCAPVPNFPSFMPLHEWLPWVFAAPGYCDDESWQFLGLGMPYWMFGIFIAYALVGLVFFVIQILVITVLKQNRQS